MLAPKKQKPLSIPKANIAKYEAKKQAERDEAKRKLMAEITKGSR